MVRCEYVNLMTPYSGRTFGSGMEESGILSRKDGLKVAVLGRDVVNAS